MTCRLNKIFEYSTSTSRIDPLLLESNLDDLFIHLKPLTGNFWDIPHAYKLLASKYSRYDDSVFLS